MIILIPWIIFSILAGVIADNKGRSGVGFFFLSLLLSPIVGLIWALACQKNTEVLEKKDIQSGSMRKCPFCAEMVKAEAKICRYCQRELPEKEKPTISSITAGRNNGSLAGAVPLAEDKTYIQCPICGHPKNDNSNFCSKCEYDFRVEEELKKLEL